MSATRSGRTDLVHRHGPHRGMSGRSNWALAAGHPYGDWGPADEFRVLRTFCCPPGPGATVRWLWRYQAQARTAKSATPRRIQSHMSGLLSRQGREPLAPTSKERLLDRTGHPQVRTGRPLIGITVHALLHGRRAQPPISPLGLSVTCYRLAASTSRSSRRGLPDHAPCTHASRSRCRRSPG